MSLLDCQAPPPSTSSEMPMDQNNENPVEVEENTFQPIVVPCAQVNIKNLIEKARTPCYHRLSLSISLQRAPDLTLMQPVFPTTSSYVIVSFLHLFRIIRVFSLFRTPPAKPINPFRHWPFPRQSTCFLIILITKSDVFRFQTDPNSTWKALVDVRN